MVNPELRLAIAEAQLLLAFASRNGKSLTEETVGVMVKSGAQSEMSEAEETAFWTHFALLTAAVAPVSAESVRAMASLDGGKSPVQKTVRRYTITAIAALVVLVVLQAYWAVGALIIADLKSTEAKFKEVEMRILAERKTPDDAAPGQAQPQDGAPGDGSGKRGQNAARNRMELNAQKENLEIYLAANYHWLMLWNSIPNLIVNIDEIDEIDQIGRDGPPTAPEMAAKEYKKKTVYLQCTTVTMEILQKYMLPLIYGFLGACVYILRNLSYKIKNYAYINASVINFHIRLCLGTLAGIAIVWFVSPEKAADPLLSLSPLALAFLAGYSVELLFALMDTVINAFTGSGSAPKEERQS